MIDTGRSLARSLIYADLAGLQEVAATLGVDVNRVRGWVERRKTTRCPAPVKGLVMGKVYSMQEWLDWYDLWSGTRGSEPGLAHRDQN